jgi:hypothetical protein
VTDGASYVPVVNTAAKERVFRQARPQYLRLPSPNHRIPTTMVRMMMTTTTARRILVVETAVTKQHWKQRMMRAGEKVMTKETTIVTIPVRRHQIDREGDFCKQRRMTMELKGKRQ